MTTGKTVAAVVAVIAALGATEWALRRREARPLPEPRLGSWGRPRSFYRRTVRQCLDCAPAYRLVELALCDDHARTVHGAGV